MRLPLVCGGLCFFTSLTADLTPSHLHPPAPTPSRPLDFLPSSEAVRWTPPSPQATLLHTLHADPAGRTALLSEASQRRLAEPTRLTPSARHPRLSLLYQQTALILWPPCSAGDSADRLPLHPFPCSITHVCACVSACGHIRVPRGTRSGVARAPPECELRARSRVVAVYSACCWQRSAERGPPPPPQRPVSLSSLCAGRESCIWCF